MVFQTGDRGLLSHQQKREQTKEFCHCRGCCLVTLITELPAWAVQANKSASAFLTKIEKEECNDDDDDDDDDDHHHTTGQAGAVGFVG